MKIGDLLFPIAIICIILMIIIPVPLGLLDLLLSINITISLVILLISMFNTEPLQFSIFPSVLLITTLFRLALNISSTRNILSRGDAGEVIAAFGDFVIGGDAVVGFIVFVIITIVQFLVITKGSERVAEVAARFTLDAMPGKQMAIDADLNAGLITENDARARRQKVQRESDFYGAMDGATKFVKGDAIAGIIITVVNILAGFALGSLRMGIGIGEALSRFTLLTVGDGLVSQIPALMISTATGIVVTRAASDSNLGEDVIAQLFSRAYVMYIAAAVLAGLALTPMPDLPFLAMAALFAYLGYRFREKTRQGAELEPAPEGEARSEEIRRPENIIPLLQVDPIELEFGYGIIPLADPNQGGDLFDRLVMIRRQIALEYGVVVPMIRLRDNIQLEPNQYIIKIKGAEVAQGSIMFDQFLAMNPGNVEGDIDGIDTVEPAFGLPAKWINENDRERAEVMGYTVVDPSSIISTHLTEVIKRHSHELLGRQEVKQLIDNLRENNSTLVDELIPSQMSIGDVQKVLQNLLREGVSIRDLVTIAETLADYSSVTRDANVLTEYVRQGIGRMLTRSYVTGRQLKVVTLDQELESRLMQAIKQSDSGTYLSLEPMESQAIINSLAVQIQSLLSMGEQPIVLTAPIVRLYFKRLTEQYIPDLVVLSYNELESSIEVKSVGMVTL